MSGKAAYKVLAAVTEYLLNVYPDATVYIERHYEAHWSIRPVSYILGAWILRGGRKVGSSITLSPEILKKTPDEVFVRGILMQMIRNIDEGLVKNTGGLLSEKEEESDDGK